MFSKNLIYRRMPVYPPFEYVGGVGARVPENWSPIRSTFLNYGALETLPVSGIQVPTISQAIKSRMYIEDGELFPTHMLGVALQVPMLQPVITMLALGCLGKEVKDFSELESETEKSKISIFGAKDLQIFPNVKSTTIGYQIHWKRQGEILNELILVKLNRPENEVLGTLVHEATHSAINRLFKNEANPWHVSDGDALWQMHDVVDATQKRFDDTEAYAYWNSDASYNKEEQRKFRINAVKSNLYAYRAINNVFQINRNNPAEDMYRDAEGAYAKELIVRVPQIIAALGEDRGVRWLEEFTPELLEFYKKNIEPRIIEHLAKENVERRLDLSDICLLETPKTKEEKQVDAAVEAASEEIKKYRDLVAKPLVPGVSRY